MIKFFRKIRQKMLIENKFSKYLLYAIGEILLVVIGILIALQVNNLNEARKTRDKEVSYLENVKNDLQFSILGIDEFIANRKRQVISATKIIEHYNGKPVEDWNEFNRYTADIYTWQRFFQIDNTFQELMNSGNLAIISNDSIKNELMNLDLLYKKLKYNEDHFRYDVEVTLYEPSYGMSDLNTLINNYIYQLSDGNAGDLGDLKEEDFSEMLKDQKQKNGFVFALFEFSEMISKFDLMKIKCENIIAIINKDLRKQ
jgi:hypothetical protein